VRSLIQAVQPGQDATLTVSRAGDAVDLSVTLVAPAAEGQVEEVRPYLGLTVHPGVVVAEVLPGSPAEAAGLARGDVIQSANGTPVLAGEQLRQAVLWEQLRRAVETDPAALADTDLSLEVSRSGQVREVKVPLPLAQPPLSA
jgi:S1-C subfamily serine protease